mgnify:CR=1 FL=1
MSVNLQHWIFDMDGTLTIAVHDFQLIRRELGVPQGEDILGYLARLPEAESAQKHAWLLAHERELALASQPAEGINAVLERLRDRDVKMGILTRNARELAHITLESAGLAEFFPVEWVLGRDEAAPKPQPDGILHLAAEWGVPPSEVLMVGDNYLDLAAARNAGAPNILLVAGDNPWPEWSDVHLQDAASLERRIAAA